MEDRKNEYQNWTIDLFVNVLKNRNIDNQYSAHGYKYSLKNGVACHYASMYWNGEEYINMWQINFSNSRYYGAEKPILLSQTAYDLIKQIKTKEIGFRDRENGKKPILHWEHITPNGYVYDKLLALPDNEITEEKVKNCFRHHKLIILAKSEVGVLDGAGEEFTDGDKKLLEEWKNKLNINLDEDIKSMKNEKGIYYSCKNHGSGLARIAHLWNNDIRFRKFSENTEYDIEQIVNYLEDTDFSYEKE